MNKNIFKKVNWCVSDVCNLSCWFCHPNDINKKLQFPDINISYKIVDFINSLSSNITKIYLTGGEPLLYPYIKNILNKFYKNLNIIIKTNFEYELKLLADIISENSNILFIPTFHANFSDEKQFFKKVKFAHNYNLIKEVHFTFENSEYEYIQKYYLPLYKKISFEFPDIKLVLKNPCKYFSYIDIKCTDKSVEKLFNIPINRGNSEKFVKCCFECTNYLENIDISSSGDIYLCYLKRDQKGKKIKLFNILDKNMIKLHDFYSRTKNISFIYDKCEYLKLLK